MSATTRHAVISAVLLLAAACGSDGDSSDEATPVTASEAAGSASDVDAASDVESETASEAEPDAPPASGGGAATLTLANGEIFEFATVLCTLEPQMAAGSEILFTAVSYDDPGLDITQFGDEGTITGIASISVYDGDFATLWEANSMLGSDVELTLEGSTIRGTGSFFEGEEFGGETIEGEIVANC